MTDVGSEGAGRSGSTLGDGGIAWSSAGAPTPPDLPAEPPMPDTHRASRRVLVVDDNRDAAETLALLLRQRGHEVKLARDGEEAQVTASSFQPEAVILDIGLPGMDGFEVARRLRTDRAEDHFLLIAISGYGQDDDRRRAREVGFDHYFTKPVSFEALRDLLSGLSRGD